MASTSFQVRGVVSWIQTNTEHVGADRRPLRRFALDVDEGTPYKQTLTFETVGPVCTMLDRYNIGDVVDVSFNIRGAVKHDASKGRVYFTNLKCWRMDYPKPTSGRPATDAERQRFNKQTRDYRQDFDQLDEARA